ncbi:protein EMBRYO DEFECTIVE 514 [Carica papaya]|uniref:protein EMBRYO DEFECTIVE 514 n=1 Tax=Carica papaya TaxID=3649 RepID=UPI000B8CEEE2|nr:protein EMBRYO DEFECTIVE 514 [Carica papaya]
MGSEDAESLWRREVGQGEGRRREWVGPGESGPKEFGSSVEMFDYFYKALHFWPPSLNVNKYEYMVLLDLIKKGHPEPARKIGKGIQAFQVRFHPLFKSRCFFVVREDESVDDFSFRKCVAPNTLLHQHDMKMKSDNNRTKNGGGGKGRGGKFGGGKGGHGRGRGGKSRH